MFTDVCFKGKGKQKRACRPWPSLEHGRDGGRRGSLAGLGVLERLVARHTAPDAVAEERHDGDEPDRACGETAGRKASELAAALRAP